MESVLLELQRQMTMDKLLVSHSKFLSLVLRHAPEKIGIELDDAGWTSIDGLILAASRSGRNLDWETILRVVHENDKQRFAISSDGTQIRANQGHSVDVELGLVPTPPPEILFHGTVGKFIDSIKSSGLIPVQRQHVHLSSDVGTANVVAARRGKPVILTIQSRDMAEAGHDFYLSANGVWLTNSVPVAFIRFQNDE